MLDETKNTPKKRVMIAEPVDEPSEAKEELSWKMKLKSNLIGFLEYLLLPWEGPILGLRVFRSQVAIFREMDRQRRVNHFIIHPFSRFRSLWDVLMVVVLMCTLIILPIELAFYSDDLRDPAWMVVNLLMDCTFMCDICLNFRTGFIHPFTEEVILTNKEVIRNYASGWFIMDLISSVPVDYMVVPRQGSLEEDIVLTRTLRMLRLARLLSLLRIFRFVRLMRYVRKIEQVIMALHSKSQSLQFEGRMVTFVNLVFIIAVFSHWNGCIQYFVPFLMDFPEDSWPVIERLHDHNRTVFTKYTHSVYRAMSHMVSIGYGHQMPMNDAEIWLTILSMMLGATFYAIFIGHISSLVMALNYSGRKFEEKVAECREYMKFRKIPVILQQRVLDYFEHRYQRKIFDERGILHEEAMSYPLKKDILMHNCQGLVEKVPFLATSPSDLIVDVIMKLQPQVFFPNDVIVQAGKRGDAMYFIEHGRVEVRMTSGTTVKTLEDGMHFGEIALLYEERRVASVIAVEVCDIYILSKKDFCEVLEDYPEMRSIMMAVARKRIKSIVDHHDGRTLPPVTGPVKAGSDPDLAALLDQDEEFGPIDSPSFSSDNSERLPSMVYVRGEKKDATTPQVYRDDHTSPNSLTNVEV